MINNETAYKKAQKKIADALINQATKLDLSCRPGATDAEKLTRLPESLAQLTQLKHLSISNNLFTAIPESIGQLKQLQHLDAWGNQLQSLPNSIGKLSNLQTLLLMNNRLTRLPQSIGQLSQLKTLYLDNNQLAVLPNTLGQLEYLNQLNLSLNQLTTLPESIGKLKQLKSLILYSNRLERLPNSIGEITELQELWLGKNRLTILPPSLIKLSKLNNLLLHGNTELNIPTEILGRDASEENFVSKPRTRPSKILNYYFSTQGKEGSELRELKLLVVGRGGVGKTSLIRRLNGEPLNSHESETHGINISPLRLDCQDGTVTARVWDFGGQHVLHAMHEFFLTARSLYLLVLGEREDMAERDAAYWLQLIRSYAGNAPVVVALNKNKGQPREMDRESLERDYGPILAWVSTECSDGFDTTIESLREALTNVANNMPEVRNRFPTKSWKIKEWLENMQEPYIDLTAYQQKCAELGEQNLAEQEKLAAWLNDLGIAINYANDERLNNTTVLKPDWLANGIYALLRANDSHHPQPLAPDATLTAEQLGTIYVGAEKLKMLKAADYPAEKWPFLLQLMNSFQLAFPIDDTNEKLLVPTLLPLEPPPNCNEPETADRTRLRYEFTVVPGPLLPKLLVRTFSLIDGERRWRRGAMLRYGKAQARVWTSQDERWVHITAVGNQDDRRELLTMLRTTLDELFLEYKNLQTTEQWEYKDKWVPRETLEEFGVLDPDTNQARTA